MGNTTKSASNGSIADSHEDRILRLEDGTSDVREDLAGCRSDIKHLQGTLDRIDSKIDLLKDNVDKHASDILARVTVLEVDKRQIAARFDAVKKMLGWIVGAAGAAFLAKYGEDFYHWLTLR